MLVIGCVCFGGLVYVLMCCYLIVVCVVDLFGWISGLRVGVLFAAWSLACDVYFVI